MAQIFGSSTKASEPALEARGRLEQVFRGVLTGWYFDPADPDLQAEVEVLADGAVIATGRADVLRTGLFKKGMGDGRHGFTIPLPETLFDGIPRTLSARVVGGEALFRFPLEALVLNPSDLPDYCFAISSVQDGIVSGHLYDRRAPDLLLNLRVLVDGQPVARVNADMTAPGEGSAAAGHGYSFDIRELVGDASLTDPIMLAVADAGRRVPLGEPLTRAGLASVVFKASSDGIITAQLQVPGGYQRGQVFEVFLNGELVEVLAEPDVTAGLCRYDFVLPRPDGDEPLELRIVEAGTGTVLAGGPVPVPPAGGGGLLRNPRFAEWQGVLPADWAVPAAMAPYLVPTTAPQGDAVAFDVPDELMRDGVELLSQRISLSALPGDARRLDFLIDHAAAMPGRVDLVLRLRQDDGTPVEVTSRLTVPREWSRRMGRMILPAPASALDAAAELALVVHGAGLSRYRLAALAMSAAGVPLDEPAPLPSAVREGGNAVRNGEFDHWSGPLRLPVTARRCPLTDGWTYAGKTDRPQAEVSLAPVVIHDPARGVGRREAFGITVAGTQASGFVRLEAEIDPFELRRSPPGELSFFAASPAGSSVDRVFLMSRRHNTEGGHEDQVVGTLARRLPFSPRGHMQRIPVAPDLAATLAPFAIEMARDPALELLLVLEVSGTFAVTIAAVRLGTSEHDVGAPGYLRFEDPAITEQLPRLKMVSTWNAPVAARPAVHGPLASATAIWRRPEPTFPSIDILVCVYNAATEVAACLQSIVEHTTVPHTITIVDDGSEAPTAMMLDRFARGKPWVRIHRNAKNQGYTLSANLGLSTSDAEWVVLLNSDTVVTPGWIEGMVDCARSDPQIAFVGPLSNAASWQSVPDVKDARGGWKVNLLPLNLDPTGMASLVRERSERQYPRVPLLNGFCTMMRTDVLARLQYLDEASFPMGYGEENDLCVRAGKAGYQLAIADDVYVYHSKSASFGSERRKLLSKAGNRALAEKHPDVDFRALELKMAEALPVVALRGKLRAALQAHGGGGELDGEGIKPGDDTVAVGHGVEQELAE